jgi:dTDP-L-rhamnose 4-epimerase
MTERPLGTLLVTGGAGFIGVALARQLAARAERWVALDSLHPQVHASGERPRELVDAAELVVGDVADPQVWSRLLETVRPDVVVHLAAETGTAQSLHEATRHATVNVVGTTVMLDAFAAVGHVPGQIVLSSSRAVYGEGRWQQADGTIIYPGLRTHEMLEAGTWDFPDAVPLPSSIDTTQPTPSSIYAGTKLAQEHLLSAWCGSHGVELTVLRLQNVYGPGQSLINSYTGIVSLFSQLAMKGDVIPIYEDGQIVRDFVFIDDIATAFVAAIDSRGAAAWRGFDVGSGVPSTILTLAEAISDFHAAPAPVITGAYRDGDVRSASCSIDATLEALDWSPRWSLESGVAALQEWIAGQPRR